MPFSVQDIPNLAGKTFVVTGGNAGLGYETKANEAIAKITKVTPGAKIEFLELKLNDLKQVDAAAKKLVSSGVIVDVLINNAGIFNTPFALTSDGIEEQFGVNHVGHFAFTMALMPAILKSTEPRIVNVSSTSHTQAPKEGILFDKLNDSSALSSYQRYGQSKLANILFTKSLHKRFGDRIYVNSANPGFTATDVGQKQENGIMKLVINNILKPLFSATVLDGALTQIYLACSTEIVEKGYKDGYFAPIADKKRGEKELSALGRNEDLAEKLWQFTENLVKEKIAA
ncbi:NAD(P)-binding protein [Rhizoclosmatium globosum]|uniref:NAD(P)-binding protein n=1 Tax=Rhizoclosmatium globosum TaxID=329046 RepID=A0A1Y2CLK5_9FUNG|nr:NAD(P)-binding protein [Rhizoclosmatium globosum]|eukprot:ORY47225.1 NAD(P)-binding protein [Rhizoclosmatium globosum]